MPVELKTRGRSLIVLSPPGPQRREANLAAAGLFSLSGDPVGLAIPDLLVLASGHAKAEAGTRLRLLWEDLEGDFTCRGIERRESGYYLRVDGPLGLLASRAEALLDESLPLPLEIALGFYLGGGALGADNAEKQLDAAIDRRFSWRACSLSLLEAEGDFEGLLRLSWRERATAWRPKKREKSGNRD